MVRTPVVSTNVRAVGYCDGILEVEFLTGSIYHYYSVPFEAYRQMVSYPHPGTFLARYIKGLYSYRRIA